MPAEPASRERASVLASLAQVLMLRGDLRESHELAEQAIAIARAVGDRAVEAHALNTLGVDVASLGPTRRGDRAPARVARDRGVAGTDGQPPAHVHEPVGRPRPGRQGRGGSGARARGRPDRSRAGHDARLGGLPARGGRQPLQPGSGASPRRERLIGEAIDAGATGLQGGFVHEIAARITFLTGRYDESESHFDDARRLLRRTAGSMWLAPLQGHAVEIAERDDDIAGVRRAVAWAQEAITDEAEHVFYSRELYLPALRAEAGAAERARAARDAEGEQEARRSGRALAERMHELANVVGEEGVMQPQVVADLARVDAELARIEGQADPEGWSTAARLSYAVGNRVDAAYARLREAESLLETGADATAALREAHSIASDCGAVPLRESCERVARRARIRLGDEPPATAPSTADPFGLTAREREVLVLVAAGRTNRQIGEQLYMSEKTASVHVSRILAKLEVSTRGEAGAVAHKLGLDE